MGEPLNCRLRGGETGLSSLIPGGIDLKQSNSSSGIISKFRVNYERYIGLFQDLEFLGFVGLCFEERNATQSQLSGRSVFVCVFPLRARSAVGDVGSVALHSTGFCPRRCIAESCKFYCLKI